MRILIPHFPDLIHLEQIRRHLWNGREFGRAAVMIGAGFSRNSEKIIFSLPDFPLWRNLAETMFDALYPLTGELSEESWRHLRSTMTTGASLRLASEYEAAFTRPNLDDLLINAIPDNGYRPGNLHRLLLSLPWSDVFTTNYDSLLERTRPYIHDRKYDLIQNISDIPITTRPRIVKLHGSFPSHRPFIITEEDFRTYPQKFTPFVNVVQQSIMENVFCLIGFSGDDPNFLSWTGWVRDHLGEHTPPLYLCGILNLSTFQRKLLEGRKVIPIDLSPVFPQSSWPDPSVRHAKAMEWFLLTLLHGAPPNIIHWPKPVSRVFWQPSEGIPTIPPGPRPLSKLSDQSPKTIVMPLPSEGLEEIYEAWRKKREEYPGWVVAPHDNREKLWDFTEYWFEPILGSINQLPSPKNLLLLYELNWRLEKILAPYPVSHAERILTTIDQFNPFPGRYSSHAQFRPDKNEFVAWDWQQIAGCWVELLFAIIRTWRENLNGDRFLASMEAIKDVVVQKSEWQCRWHHEYCLFYLAQSDFTRTRAILSDWRTTPELPFWETRKAAVLAEIGELKDAHQTAEDALSGIRSRFVPGVMDYAPLSQEGWTMLLLRSIRINRFGEDSGYLDQFTDRWEKLTTYRCNPWSEMETLETIVKGMTPPQDVLKETRTGYHPKSQSVTYHMLATTAYSKLQPAFNLSRIFEEGGIPIRSGATTLFTDAVLNAARCIEEFAPAWALSLRLRASVQPEKDNWLDLATVASMSDEEIVYLYQVFRNSFIEAFTHLSRHPDEIGGMLASTAFRRVITFVELLSRLYPRLSEQHIEDLLQLGVAAYLSPITRSHHSLHLCHKVLFKRAMESATTEQKLQFLPQLLSLPIPGDGGFDVSSADSWDDPFMHFGLPTNIETASSLDRSSLSSTISNLLRIIRDGQPESRWRAILRLSLLHEIKILTAQETGEFAQALWSKLDDVGFPADTRSLKNAALILPEPQPGIAKEKLKAYLLSKEFIRQAQEINSAGQQGISFGLSFGPQFLIREWCQSTTPVPLNGETSPDRRIDWSADEIVKLLDKAVAWWDDQKRFLNQADAIPLISDNLRQDLDGLVELLMRVILPRISEAGAVSCNAAETMINELDQCGINVYPALPLALIFNHDLYGEIVKRIQSGLFSNDQERVEGAVLGLSNWLIYSIKLDMPRPPQHFLDHFVEVAASRRQPGLDVVLEQLTSFIQNIPEIFEERHLELILLGLDPMIVETDLGLTIDSCGIRHGEKPYMRQIAAKLAYALFQYYQHKNIENIPLVIERWQTVCKEDPLIQVRRAWKK